MPKSKQREPSVPINSPVAPVESADTAPEVQKEVPKTVDDPCWNCGKELHDDICPECGFDKSLVYNLNLEAEKARQRQKQQLAQQSK